MQKYVQKGEEDKYPVSRVVEKTAGPCRWGGVETV
jgi:predicted nucleotide-binding protein (sugar kinase/HSP70/actin superfamily)